MKKTKTIRREVGIVSSIILATAILILVGLVFYFHQNREDIKKELLNSFNSNLNGELIFEQIDLDLFSQFPNISLVLKNSQYFEKKDPDNLSDPIISLKRLYCEIKLSALFKDKVQVNGLHLEEGKVYFKLSEDSVFNFSQIVIPQNLEREDQNKSHFSLALNNFSIRDISLEYKDFTNNKDFSANINKIYSSINISNDSVLMILKSDFRLKHIPINNDFILKDKELTVNTDIHVLRNDSIIKMSKMNIFLGKLSLKSEGAWAYGGHKGFNLEFSLFNEFSYLNSLLLSKKGHKGFKSGEVHLGGIITHHSGDLHPIIKGTYGIHNLELAIPETNRVIKDFNINGSFNSGNRDNYSSAVILCDTIYGHSKTGYMKGNFSIEDLSQPRVKMNMDLNLDVTKYDELFSLDFITDISGEIGLKANIDIYRTKDLKWQPIEGSEMDMQIKNLALSIPELDTNEEQKSKISRLIYHNNYAQVQSGSAIFNGDIQLDSSTSFPTVNLNYNLSDFKVTIPETTQNIEEFKVSGSFNSGHVDDLSEAIITGENLTFKYGQSSLQGGFILSNRVTPKIKASLGVNLLLDDFSEIIPDSLLQDLEGRVGLELNYDGGKLNDSTWVLPSGEALKINLDKVRCSIPAITDNIYLNGMLSGSYDSLNISTLEIEAGNTQLSLNGDVHNLSSLTDSNKNIQLSNGKILAECFDLPQFIQWLPTTPAGFKERFGYKIKDADINIDAAFTKNLYEEDKTKPFIYIDIASGSGKLDSLLPPFDLGRVQLNVSKDNTTKIISFPELELIFDEASVSGNLFIYANELKYDSLKTNLTFDKIQPNAMFTYYKPDSLKPKDSTLLDGNFDIFMAYDRMDNYRKFENLDLNLSNILYLNSDDTIACENYLMQIADVTYNNKAKPTMLASLSANSNINITKISSALGSINSLKTTLTARKGDFYLSDLLSNTQSQSAKGSLVYKPFATQAIFGLKYNLDHFATDELFKCFNIDPLLQGFVDVDLKLTAKCASTKELLQTLEGSFEVQGEDLLLQGLDLDKLMYKIDRTQNFNLVDVAGVVVAGPLGLVVTKGANATSIFINNYEDSTPINALISQLKIDSGIVSLSDVAFSTKENRVALKGQADLPQAALNINAAIIDSSGVATWQQGVNGTISDPKISEIKPVRSILKPIDNLVKNVFDVEGEVYYDGKIEAPVSK